MLFKSVGIQILMSTTVICQSIASDIYKYSTQELTDFLNTERTLQGSVDTTSQSDGTKFT